MCGDSPTAAPSASESHPFRRTEGLLPDTPATNAGLTPSTYVPRRPEEPALCQVVADELETFLVRAREHFAADQE